MPSVADGTWPSVRILALVIAVAGLAGALCSSALIALVLLLSAILTGILCWRPAALPCAPDWSRREILAQLPLLLSIFWGVLISADLATGWREGRSAIQFCLLPLFAWMAPSLPGRRLQLLALVFFLLELLTALVNWHLAGHPADHRFEGFRPYGTDANLALYFLLVSFFFALRAERPWAGLAGVLVAGLLLTLTQNRAEVLAAALLLPFTVNWRQAGRRWLALGGFGLLLLVFFGNPLNHGRERVLGALHTAVAEQASGKVETSMGTRYELWKASLIIFCETRGRGTGYGDFRADLARLQAEGRISPKLNTTLHAHSLYFHALLCGGLVGLAGLLATVLMVVVALRRAASIVPEASHLRMLLLAAFLLTGLTDANLEDGARIFGLLFAWLLAGALFPAKAGGRGLIQS